jgi:hypothetical protein
MVSWTLKIKFLGHIHATIFKTGTLFISILTSFLYLFNLWLIVILQTSLQLRQITITLIRVATILILTLLCA